MGYMVSPVVLLLTFLLICEFFEINMEKTHKTGHHERSTTTRRRHKVCVTGYYWFYSDKTPKRPQR